MRVLLKVWSSNPDYNGGCDYAAVEISEELAKLTLRRIHILSEQKALDPVLYETYYWHYSTEYFSPWAVRPVEPGEIDEPVAVLEEILDSLEVDAKEMVIAPPDFRVSEAPRRSCGVRSDDRARWWHRVHRAPTAYRHLSDNC
ncbi:MAG TPA: hypothetical protein VJQ82_23140 [Terriglobales bacterium]|nr:hypothetical protein [Terriglobales bacterium]